MQKVVNNNTHLPHHQAFSLACHHHQRSMKITRSVADGWLNCLRDIHGY